MDEPFRPFPSGRTDQIAAGVKLIVDQDAFDLSPFFYQVIHSRIGHDIDLTFEEIAHMGQNLAVDVGP